MTVNHSLDITDAVEFGLNDRGHLPLTRCVCGKTWKDWHFILMDNSHPQQCPACGRKMWFSATITVWQEAPPEDVPDATENLERSKESRVLAAHLAAATLPMAMDDFIRGVFNARGH